jgi:enoyl-CoA hydratase/carnithine racemase
VPGLHFTVDANVATLVIDNPPQNRLSTEMLADFAAAVRKMGSDPDLRAVLVRADGPHFSFGGDISTWLELEPQQMRENIAGFVQMSNAFEQLPVPVVVAVHGKCMGGGFELALRADVIVAADNAVFAHSEQTIGLVTLLGGIQRVAERAGRTRAMRWALTSELVPAKEMLAAGVVTDVVAAADLDSATRAWVTRLANGPTQAHVGHKRMLNAWASGGIAAADQLIPELTERLMKTDDARRGIASAQEALRKGAPRPTLDFKGR